MEDFDPIFDTELADRYAQQDESVLAFLNAAKAVAEIMLDDPELVPDDDGERICDEFIAAYHAAYPETVRDTDDGFIARPGTEGPRAD